MKSVFFFVATTKCLGNSCLWWPRVGSTWRSPLPTPQPELLTFTPFHTFDVPLSYNMTPSTTTPFAAECNTTAQWQHASRKRTKSNTWKASRAVFISSQVGFFFTAIKEWLSKWKALQALKAVNDHPETHPPCDRSVKWAWITFTSELLLLKMKIIPQDPLCKHNDAIIEWLGLEGT